MVAILSLLPGFYCGKPEPVAAPELRTRDLTAFEYSVAVDMFSRKAELLCFLEPPEFEHGHVCQRTALFADPRVQLAFGWTSREVGVALVYRRAGNTSFEAYLPAKLVPMKNSSCVRVVVQLSGLARFIVAIEGYITFATRKIFDQDHARGGPGSAVDGCQRHSVRVSLNSPSNCVVKPLPD